MEPVDEFIQYAKKTNNFSKVLVFEAEHKQTDALPQSKSLHLLLTDFQLTSASAATQPLLFGANGLDPAGKDEVMHFNVKFLIFLSQVLCAKLPKTHNKEIKNVNLIQLLPCVQNN